MNWTDFGSRMYDASLGRWHNIDVASHKFTGISPYSFVANSPLGLTDPDGEDWYMYQNGSTTCYQWVDSQEDTYKADGVVYQNIGAFMAFHVGDSWEFWVQDRLAAIFNDAEIQTFAGYEDARLQQWDGFLLVFAYLHNLMQYDPDRPETGVDPNLVKSVMIQENGGDYTKARSRWKNDPMTMFYDYAPNKGVGTESQTTSKKKETDPVKQFRNGIESIRTGIGWMYGAKARNGATWKDKDKVLPVDFSDQPFKWRMVNRYNASGDKVKTDVKSGGDGNTYIRHYIYAQRVFYRYNNPNTQVPLGDKSYDDKKGY